METYTVNKCFKHLEKGRLDVVKTFQTYNGLSHRLHFIFLQVQGSGLLIRSGDPIHYFLQPNLRRDRTKKSIRLRDKYFPSPIP